jgi:hypothetical protein
LGKISQKIIVEENIMSNRVFKSRLALVVLVFFALSVALAAGCQSKQAAAPEKETPAQPQQVEEKYPTKPIRLIVHTNAGGGADTNIRRLQPYLEKELGVAVMIDNRPGAASIITSINHSNTGSTNIIPCSFSFIEFFNKSGRT